MKRLCDLLLVLATLPLWLPLALAVALAVLVCDGRPVLYVSDRAGKGGVPFRFLKFRTMRARRHADEGDFARLTRLGRFLRTTSLDELPQLLHVLSGRMSLVGPRPLPVSYLPRYTPYERRRHAVRPGLTGWAQVIGRNKIPWKVRFALDVWYVDRRTLALDAWILLLTVGRVLSRSGVDGSEYDTMSEYKGGNS